jgi:DNA repair ATPase RecN
MPKKLTSLSLSNFQPWKFSKLEFHPGVNGITGESHTGKTALLRALAWPLENKLKIGHYRSWWGGDTIVGLGVSLDDNFHEDLQVSRIKTAKDNSYEISSMNGEDPIKLDAVGQGHVPDQVAEILSFSDINIQNQHDAPFLLNSNAGDVAKYLSSIVDLDVIYTTNNNINKRQRDNAKEIDDVKAKINACNEKIKGLLWVNEAETEINLALLVQKQCEALESDMGKLLEYSSILDRVENDLKEYEGLEGLDEVFREVSELNVLVEEKRAEFTALADEYVSVIPLDQSIKDLDALNLGSLQQEVEECSNLAQKITALKLDIKDLDAYLSVLGASKSEIELLSKTLQLEDEVLALTLLRKEIDTGDITLSKMKNLEKEIQDVQQKLVVLNREIKEQEEELWALMPPICPLCGSEVRSCDH